MEALLCNHLSQVLSGSVRQASINSFVDTCMRKYQSGTFLQDAKVLTLALERWRAGHSNPFSDIVGHWSTTNKPIFKDNPNWVNPKDPLLRELISSCGMFDDLSDYRIAAVSKLHTVLLKDTLSQSEADAIRESINGQPKMLVDLSQQVQHVMQSIIDQYLQWYPNIKDESTRIYNPLIDFPANQSKRLFSPITSQSEDRSQLVNYNLEALLGSKLFRPIYDKYPGDVSKCIFGDGIVLNKELARKISPSYDFDGQISVIHELGYKNRVVATPSAVVLSLNNPLAQRLWKFVNFLPTQGVNSHEQTTEKLSQLVDGERTFYSIDSSSFTDDFPYKGFQRNVLLSLLGSGIIRQFDIDVQDAISNIKFKAPASLRCQFLTYTKGTPMGTYASFVLASLSNDLLCTIAYCDVYRPQYDDNPQMKYYRNIHFNYPWKVIGDDIVIWDPKVAQRYMYLLQQLGVEVSEAKTIVSNQLVLMCSKFITNNGVFIQKKIRDPYANIHRFIDEYRYYQGKLSIPDNWSYLRDLPHPFGVQDPDPYHPLHQLAKVKEIIRPFLLQNVGRSRDYLELFNRAEVLRKYSEPLNLSSRLDRLNQVLSDPLPNSEVVTTEEVNNNTLERKSYDLPTQVESDNARIIDEMVRSVFNSLEDSFEDGERIEVLFQAIDLASNLSDSLRRMDTLPICYFVPNNRYHSRELLEFTEKHDIFTNKGIKLFYQLYAKVLDLHGKAETIENGVSHTQKGGRNNGRPR